MELQHLGIVRLQLVLGATNHETTNLCCFCFHTYPFFSRIRCVESSRQSNCGNGGQFLCPAMPPTPSPTTPAPNQNQVLEYVGSTIGTLIVVSIAGVSCAIYIRKKRKQLMEQSGTRYVKLAEDYDD
jgi:hypothetical protein